MTAAALLWSATKQQALEKQLVGFWAADQWDLANSPIPITRVRKKSRRLRFNCRSTPLNIELKYACRQKFISGDWSTPWASPYLHTLIRWLNELDLPDASFLARSLDEWESSLRTWLSEHGIYTKVTTTRVDATQQLRHSAKEPAFFHTLHQIYAVLLDIYDDRLEEEKEIWDVRNLAASQTLHYATTNSISADYSNPGCGKRQSVSSVITSRSTQSRTAFRCCARSPLSQLF